MDTQFLHWLCLDSVEFAFQCLLHIWKAGYFLGPVLRHTDPGCLSNIILAWTGPLKLPKPEPVTAFPLFYDQNLTTFFSFLLTSQKWLFSHLSHNLFFSRWLVSVCNLFHLPLHSPTSPGWVVLGPAIQSASQHFTVHACIWHPFPLFRAIILKLYFIRSHFEN